MILKSSTVAYIKTSLHQSWKQLVVPSPVFKGGNASQRYTPWDKSITSWAVPSPKLVWHLNPNRKIMFPALLGGVTLVFWEEVAYDSLQKHIKHPKSLPLLNSFYCLQYLWLAPEVPVNFRALSKGDIFLRKKTSCRGAWISGRKG